MFDEEFTLEAYEKAEREKRRKAFEFYVNLTGNPEVYEGNIDDWALRKTCVKFNYDLADLKAILLDKDF